MEEMSRKSDYTTGNLLDYLHYQNYHKLIVIGLSRKKIYEHSLKKLIL